jgi:hypothetical protein
MFEVPNWSRVNNPYHSVSRNSSQMLITAGDSWTYGDSLGDTKVRLGRDDTAYRTKHIYGAAMSRELGSSWINLALPGASNSLVIGWIDTLLSHRWLHEDTICVLTLTESGRHEDLQLIDRSLGTQQRALEKIVTHSYGQVDWLRLKHPKVKFVVAHNFTDRVGTTALEKTWLEVMLDRQIQNGTHIVISEHIEQMNYDARFPDVLDIMDRAAARMDLLDSCEYCFKEDSRHPNEQGHELWANYLLTQI